MTQHSTHNLDLAGPLAVPFPFRFPAARNGRLTAVRPPVPDQQASPCGYTDLAQVSRSATKLLQVSNMMDAGCSSRFAWFGIGISDPAVGQVACSTNLPNALPTRKSTALRSRMPSKTREENDATAVSKRAVQRALASRPSNLLQAAATHLPHVCMYLAGHVCKTAQTSSCTCTPSPKLGHQTSRNWMDSVAMEQLKRWSLCVTANAENFCWSK